MMPAPEKLSVDIVSDVMCPWCYIGKRKFEQALPSLTDVPMDVMWRPYQLDATLPPGGKDRQTYLSEKFGGPERAAAIYEHIEDAGEAVGLDFAFDRIKVSPNTLDAHRLVRWASTTGLQDQIVEALFEAFFMQGENIGDHGTLIRIAQDAGLDAGLIGDLLVGEADIDLTKREIELATNMGVTGVPCFIIAGKYAVSGAQDPEIMVQAIRQAWDEKLGETEAASTEKKTAD
ncbi:MAG: DsbA family oxidoreductase [Pseudomonadota bacterium]